MNHIEKLLSKLEEAQKNSWTVHSYKNTDGFDYYYQAPKVFETTDKAEYDAWIKKHDLVELKPMSAERKDFISRCQAKKETLQQYTTYLNQGSASFVVDYAKAKDLK